MNTFTQFVLYVLWFGGSLVVAGIHALYAYYATGELFYRTGGKVRRADKERSANVWFARLRKVRCFPGTVTYGLGWAVAYLAFGYALARISTLPEYVYDAYEAEVVSIIVVGLVQFFSATVTVLALYKWHNLTLATLSDFVSVAAAATVTALAIVLHVNLEATKPQLGPAISFSLFLFVRVLSFVFNIILWVKNPDDTDMLVDEEEMDDQAMEMPVMQDKARKYPML